MASHAGWLFIQASTSWLLLFRGDSGLLLISMRTFEHAGVVFSMLTGKLSARADRHLSSTTTPNLSKPATSCNRRRLAATHIEYDTLRTRSLMHNGSSLRPKSRLNRDHTISIHLAYRPDVLQEGKFDIERLRISHIA
jgi:hypothetical protein